MEENLYNDSFLVEKNVTGCPSKYQVLTLGHPVGLLTLLSPIGRPLVSVLAFGTRRLRLPNNYLAKLNFFKFLSFFLGKERKKKEERKKLKVIKISFSGKKRRFPKTKFKKKKEMEQLSIKQLAVEFNRPKGLCGMNLRESSLIPDSPFEKENDNEINVENNYVMTDADQDFLDLKSEDQKAALRGGVMKIDGAKFILTYKSHIHKGELQAFLLKATRRCKFSFFRAAHETGDIANPYLHTHCVIDIGNRFQCSKKGVFSFPSLDGPINCNLKNIGAKIHWDRCCRYLAKEDKDNADLLVQETLMGGIQGCASKGEALNKYVKRPSDVSGVSLAYDLMADKTITLTPDRKLVFWQRSIMKIADKPRSTVEEVDCPPELEGIMDVSAVWKEGLDDRLVHIVYDCNGCKGKTTFCLWLRDNFPTKYLFLSCLPPVRDLATIIGNAINGGWDGSVILINISRDDIDHKIYTAVEQLRDGFMTMSKYQGGGARFKIKDVFIFTNLMLNVGKLTHDKWAIHHIHPKFFTLDHVNRDVAKQVWESESLDRRIAEEARLIKHVRTREPIRTIAYEEIPGSLNAGSAFPY